MKPSVYIETTVVSYLVSRPSRDLIVAAHQQITREWWEKALLKFEPFVSDAVLDEVAKGDVNYARARLDAIKDFPTLELVSDADTLAEEYFVALGIPPRSKADSVHLALAVWHGIDFLTTWNCTHLASGRVRMLVQHINEKKRMRTPIICTPEELMEV